MKCVINLWYNIKIEVINKDKKRRWWSKISISLEKSVSVYKERIKKGKKEKKLQKENLYEKK